MNIPLIRQSGSENIAPTLQSRLKSAIDLMSNSRTGLRAPSKRNALGDVTNTATITRLDDDAKQAKVGSLVKPPHLPPMGILVQEFAPGQPPRRVPAWERDKASTVSSSTINASAVSSRLAIQSIVDAASPERHEAIYGSPVGLNSLSTDQQVGDSSDSAQGDTPDQFNTNFKPWLPPTTAGQPSLAGKHFKSQQQLKTEQPTLRRTQSRQLERTVEDNNLDTSTQCALPAMIAVNRSVLVGNSAINSSAANWEKFSSHDGSCDSEDSELNADIDDSQRIQIVSDGHESYDGYGGFLIEELYTTTYQMLPAKSLANMNRPVMAPAYVQPLDLEEMRDAITAVGSTIARQDLIEDMSDPFMVAAYSDEIFGYCRELENRLVPYPHYMDVQDDLDWKMRSILLNWIVQVHDQFQLMPETLFLTVNYIDRFLSAKVVSPAKLQLVGVTALLVATKYEEISCPEIREIIDVVDGGYTAEEIMKAERYMLTMLKFELGWPGPMNFLRRISKADFYDLETRTMAKYFLEVALVDFRFVGTLPSFTAAAAHCLSMLILGKGHWKFLHVYFSGYTYNQLVPALEALLHCCERPNLHHPTVYHKYSTERFREASRSVQAVLRGGFTLPSHRYSPRGSTVY